MSNGRSPGRRSPSNSPEGSSPRHPSEDELETGLGGVSQLEHTEGLLAALSSAAISSGPQPAAVQSENAPPQLPIGTNHNLGGWLYVGDYVQVDGLTVRPATFIVTTIRDSPSPPSDLGYLPSKTSFLNIAPHTLFPLPYENFKPRSYALLDQSMPPDYWELMGPPKSLPVPCLENNADIQDTLVTEANVTIKREDHNVLTHRSWKHFFIGNEVGSIYFDIDLFKINVQPILGDMNQQDCDTLMDHLTLLRHLWKDNKTTWISEDGGEEAHHISRGTTLVLIAIARRQESVAAKLIGTRPYPTVHQLRKYKKIFNFNLVVKSLIYLLPRLRSKKASEEDRTFSICAGMDLCLTLFEIGQDIDIQKAADRLITANANFQLPSSDFQVRWRSVNSATLMGIFFAAATYFATKTQARRDKKVKMATNVLRDFLAVALTIPVVTGVAAPVALLAPIFNVFAKPALSALFEKSFENEYWEAKYKAAILNFEHELRGQMEVPVELVNEFTVVLRDVQNLAIIGQPLYAESCARQEGRVQPSIFTKLKGALHRQNL
ncbi:hypothetical protein Asppvi_009063 [Aspergillus pseudoviridinutans]|uniref:Uncharacterized protein n=1 Tax=Aspergillus pseudoviridinutans TaxID=1517512 RepID=A0A9P3EYL0_9EURO|nr:uncharacterized protein Asppvi_009063 [Aspergillus pseudoviridinutans]GIJ90113.1 hypothetical protein Asppvi_009063 [Aspergillus pseudoviridinutans]